MLRAYVTRLLACGALFACVSAQADGFSSGKIVVDVHSVSAQGIRESIGTIIFFDSKDGLVIQPKLAGLTPGHHGFHVHENPSCEPKEKDGVMTAAQAAGPHYDPSKSGVHRGPHHRGHEGGHKGDLPVLLAQSDGTITEEMIVFGLSLADIVGRSVIIHAGGDNYSDTPLPLGGGGARVACGVVR